MERVREVGMSAVAELKDRRKGPAGVEFLVAWEGVDAATGLGWPDSWILEAWLSGDLRRRRRRGRGGREGPTVERIQDRGAGKRGKSNDEKVSIHT